MNSPKNLNYETRPIKFTERKMLLGTFLRICNLYKEDYQYIGFGGLAFTDFKLFHKELHINEMHNIEGGSFTKEKIIFNAPYSFIKILPEHSSVALTKINLEKKTLVWLDYDGALDNYIFQDLAILINKLPVGSIYLFTCNRELKDSETSEIYSLERFKEKFGDLSPFDLTDKDFSGTNNFLTIRKMILNLINRIIADRNRAGESLIFHQLYNLTYQEYRGANMFTFGGVITDKETKLSDLNLSSFNFVSHDEIPYKIQIPNMTLKETELVNKHLAEEHLEDLLNMKIVSDVEVQKYKTTYKYLPSFFDVRL